MNMTLRRLCALLACVWLPLALTGCAEDAAQTLVDTPTIVPDGKQDDFFSTTAQEYLVEGRTTVTLDPADAELPEAEKLTKVRRLIGYKQVVVSWFLNAWLAPKDSTDKNAGYGGFNALSKNGSFEDLDITVVDEAVYAYTTRQQLSGSFDLLERLPAEMKADGSLQFDLLMGQISNADQQRLGAGDEWFRKAPWEHFDPRKDIPNALETIRLTITRQPRSLDGWLDTPTLFADGRVDIGVHFGWDYHDASHVRESRILFGWLVDQGYDAPVKRYDDLERDSGPFTRTIVANGRGVQVEVSVFWGKPGADTDPNTDAGGKQLKRDIIESLKTREVIVYSGHSGPFWGFSMGNWKKTEEGELEDNEIRTLALPEHYQLVLAEGCETYAIGAAFYENPAKLGRGNVDIITTSTYSTANDANPVKDFLTAVVGTRGKGARGTRHHHVASRYAQLLQALEFNAWDPAMYGVHGIDDAPHIHPYADPTQFCAACTTDSACGGQGNICVNLGTDGGVCSAECTGDDGCGDGYMCASMAVELSLTGRACVPRNFTCYGDTPPSQKVIFNEVLADPPNDATGDLNEDGWIDADDDEFVELYNGSRRDISLDGWTIEDGTKVRFTFPAGTSVAAGKVVVVFGGGDVEGLAKATGAAMFVADGGLRLANGGDTVVLRNVQGNVVDRVFFGAEAGGDKSLVRRTDGDVDADFVPHPGGIPASPGTTIDGFLY
ncbi:MAG: hypothetical protein ACI9MR_004308 [Myxococcota bacterium]|jgi:hypothetical protein